MKSCADLPKISLQSAFQKFRDTFPPNSPLAIDSVRLRPNLDDRSEDTDGEDIGGDERTSTPRTSLKFGDGRVLDMEVDDADDKDASARMPLPQLLLFVLLLSIPLCGVEAEALVKFISAS